MTYVRVFCMGNKIKYLILMMVSTFLLTACAPSKDKIIEAQTKYRELVAIHNEVVEAHSAINDRSLDDELIALADNISEIETYNLNEMTNSEIDSLIQTMDSIIETYQNYLNTIGEIKNHEDETRLDTIRFSLTNGTSKTITEIALKEKGDTDPVSNALEGINYLLPGQQLIGLAIHQDINNTPWVLVINDNMSNEENELIKEDGESLLESPSSTYEIDLNLKSNKITLLYDDENKEYYLE